MNDSNEEAKPSALNLLLQTCVDGEEGYQLAADSVKDAELKETLSRYAAQRTRFRRELRVILDWLAEKPDEQKTLSGTIHQGWMNLKAVAKDGDERTILVECVRGESAAIERYAYGLKSGELPDCALITVERQSGEIKDASRRMEELVQQYEENGAGRAA